MSVCDNLKRGTVELVLLSLLQGQDMYGYQLSQKMALRSKGRFTLQEGSLYPILYRLSDKGYLSERKELVNRRRTRVYYHLEPEGEAYLAQIRKEYFDINRGILDLLRSSEGGLKEDEIL